MFFFVVGFPKLLEFFSFSFSSQFLRLLLKWPKMSKKSLQIPFLPKGQRNPWPKDKTLRRTADIENIQIFTQARFVKPKYKKPLKLSLYQICNKKCKLYNER